MSNKLFAALTPPLRQGRGTACGGGVDKVVALLLLFLFHFSFSACTSEPEKPAIVEDPELKAACDYIGGAGASTTGGMGGTLYFVTMLEDSVDPSTGKPVVGTLRYAVEQGDARTILFRVSGIIHLHKPLEITRGNLTIAGQTAPGDGICLADYPLIIKGCENVIVRFIRVRMGEKGSLDNETEYDAVSVNNCSGVVLDHLSCSWSVDECVSCYGNRQFTMQYCFVTESLRKSVHGKGSHGYGGIWGGENVSFHHNLLAHHDSRNPRFDHDYVNTLAGPIDFVNNVVYNWGGNSAYGGEGTTTAGGGRKVNFVGNYFKAGPATKSSVKYRLCNPTTTCSNCTNHHGGTVVPMQMWLADNVMFGSDAVTADNWQGIHPDNADRLNDCKASAPFTFPLSILNSPTETGGGSGLSLTSAEQALETVLGKAGCSYARDAIDARIVSEVQNGNYTYSGTTSTGGLIDTPSDVGGWPEYKTADLPKDTDGDGIPDTWEEAHGLNPKSYADSKTQTLVSDKTNLEVYLCDIVKQWY